VNLVNNKLQALNDKQITNNKLQKIREQVWILDFEICNLKRSDLCYFGI